MGTIVAVGMVSGQSKRLHDLCNIFSQCDLRYYGRVLKKMGSVFKKDIDIFPCGRILIYTYMVWA